MSRLMLSAALVLALAGCGPALRCATIDGQGIAAANGSKDGFKIILTKIVQRTMTSAMIVYRDGAAGSRALAQAIDLAVDRHGAEWTRNVAASWDTLAQSQIAQTCTAIAARDGATYLRLAKMVDEEARRRNEPVAIKAATEVLTATFWPTRKPVATPPPGLAARPL